MNSLKVLRAILAIIILSLPVHADLIPDPGVADTVDLVYTVLPDAGNNDLKVQLDLYVFHDTVTLGSIAMGFSWDNPNLQMDSAVASPLAVSSFDFLRFFFRNNDIDSTNVTGQFLFAGMRMSSNGFLPVGNRQLLASYFLTLSEWNVNDSIVIDTGRLNGGTNWTFVQTNRVPYLATWAGPKVGYDSPCCTGMTGNVDMDPGDNVDIADLTFMIDHLFGPNFPALPCFEEANVDQMGGVDIADQTLLIDHLFISFLPLEDCP